MSAAFFTAPFRIRVRFDWTLLDRPTAAVNWSGFTGPPLNTKLEGFAPGTVDVDRVTIPVQGVGPDPSPRSVSYAAAPADVSSRFLLKAPSFADFPMS